MNKRFLKILFILSFITLPSYAKKEEAAAEAPSKFIKLSPVTVSIFQGTGVSRVLTLSFVLEAHQPEHAAELIAQQRRIESTISTCLNTSSRTFSRAKNDYDLIKKIVLDQCLKDFGKDKIKDVLLQKATDRKI